MNKRLLLAILLTLGMGASSSAQEPSKPASPADAPEKAVAAYRLDFSINELEAGKKINSRQYSMNLNSSDSNELSIGTRVPVEAKQGEFEYIDIGTSIWAQFRGHEHSLDPDNGLVFTVRCKISSFAIPEQAAQSTTMPLVRQFQINASSVITPGKPLVVGSVDDPNSNHQFQLEVTATRLR